MKRRSTTRIAMIWLAGLLFVGEVGAHVGTGIVVDRRGNVWVADTSGNRLWRIETNGKLTQVASDIHSNVLALAPDDGVYLENDRHTDRWPTGLLHVDAQGRVSSAADSAEAKILTETRTLVEHSGLSNVNSMVRARDGSLFVRACNSLYRVATDGRVMEVPGGKDAGFLGNGEADCRRVLGLAVDEAGNLYVANYGKASVFKITLSGTTETVLHSSRPWVPTGVVVSGTALYVLERFGQPYGVISGLSGVMPARFRVRKIASDGKTTRLATVR
jgi:sugar lactone lactonase YvrE